MVNVNSSEHLRFAENFYENIQKSLMPTLPGQIICSNETVFIAPIALALPMTSTSLEGRTLLYNHNEVL